MGANESEIEQMDNINNDIQILKRKEYYSFDGVKTYIKYDNKYLLSNIPTYTTNSDNKFILSNFKKSKI